MTTQTIGQGVTLTTPATVTLEDFLARKYKTKIEDLRPTTKVLLNRVVDYINTTHARAPNTPESIAVNHRNFTNTLLGILDGYEGDVASDSILLWDCVLFLALQRQDDLFNARVACRHVNKVPSAQRDTFLALMTLIMQTMDIRSRAMNLRTTPLSIVYPYLNEIQKTRLTAYYANNT